MNKSDKRVQKDWNMGKVEKTLRGAHSHIFGSFLSLSRDLGVPKISQHRRQIPVMQSCVSRMRGAKATSAADSDELTPNSADMQLVSSILTIEK